MTQDISHLKREYDEIVSLYDLADDLVDTVEGSSDPASQLRTIEPLINQMEQSADMLCEDFIAVTQDPAQAPARKSGIEKSLRMLYMALDSFAAKTAATFAATADEAMLAAKAIVEKVKLQVERVVTVFVNFVKLALDRIMNKQHLDELKEHQDKIANMLYVQEQQSMGMGGM